VGISLGKSKYYKWMRKYGNKKVNSFILSKDGNEFNANYFEMLGGIIRESMTAMPEARVIIAKKIFMHIGEITQIIAGIFDNFF